MQVYSILRLFDGAAEPGGDGCGCARALRACGSARGLFEPGRWLGRSRGACSRGALDAGPAIFVGGTGLYFKALLEGLSPMPSIPAAIRETWRARLEAEGARALHAVLAGRDPVAADTLQPNDGQRIVRALEIFDASGRFHPRLAGIAGPTPGQRQHARLMVLEPDRAEVVARIERRFDAMVEQGAMEEVSRARWVDLPPLMPAMKAIGVRELATVMAGTATLPEAVAKAKAATRQYAKRQSTWFRNQLGANWRRVQPEEATDLSFCY